MTTTMDLTLENFAERTGSRFRVSKLQAARIALTGLSDDVRQSIVGRTEDEAADILEARNAKGQPLNWVEDAITLATQGWTNEMNLTREGAFQEFLADGGLERIQNRRPDIPDEVYLDPELTLDNFASKVEAIIGVARRFRVSRDQHQRIKDGELTREEALAEIVTAKQANAEATTAEDNQPEVAEVSDNE